MGSTGGGQESYRTARLRSTPGGWSRSTTSSCEIFILAPQGVGERKRPKRSRYPQGRFGLLAARLLGTLSGGRVVQRSRRSGVNGRRLPSRPP